MSTRVDVVKTTWGMVEPGALLAGADGGQWRVLEKRIQVPLLAFLLTDMTTSIWVTKTFDDEVVLLDETSGRIGAVELVMSVLQGKMLVEELAKGPDSKALRAQYRAHLYYVHHVSMSPTADKEGGTLEQLIECHAVEHAKAVPGGIPHEHRPIGELI